VETDEDTGGDGFRALKVSSSNSTISRVRLMQPTRTELVSGLFPVCH